MGFTRIACSVGVLSTAIASFVSASAAAPGTRLPNRDTLLALIQVRVGAGRSAGIVVGAVDAAGHSVSAAYGDLVWHNGGTGGYRPFIGLDKAGGVAVVLLTSSGNAGADDIGFHLLDASVLLTP